MSYSEKKDDHKLGPVNWQYDHYLGFKGLSLYHVNPLEGSINLPKDKHKLLVAFRRVRVLWFCQMSNVLEENMVPA